MDLSSTPVGARMMEAIEAYYAGMRPFWYPVLTSEELVEGKPVEAQLLGEPLALARLQGETVAFENVCRHLGAALSLGEIVGDGCYLRCRYHGWSYDKTGQCVDIPARREKSVPREARVPTYPVREAYGLVWVCLDGDPQHDIPEFSEYEDPDFHLEPLITHGPWRASATRVVMATLDDSHFPWVHSGILGDQDHPEAPDHRVWREGDYLISAYEILQPEAGQFVHDKDGVSDSVNGADGMHEVSYTNHVTPNTIRMIKSSKAGDYTLFFAACPIAYDKTLVYAHRARNFDRNPAYDEENTKLQLQIMDQDVPIVESQRPWLLPPLSSRMMLYVRPADLPLVEYQKWLEELSIPQDL